MLEFKLGCYRRGRLFPAYARGIKSIAEAFSRRSPAIRRLSKLRRRPRRLRRRPPPPPTLTKLVATAPPASSRPRRRPPPTGGPTPPGRRRSRAASPSAGQPTTTAGPPPPPTPSSRSGGHWSPSNPDNKAAAALRRPGRRRLALLTDAKEPFILTSDQQTNVKAVEWRPNSGKMIAVACRCVLLLPDPIALQPGSSLLSCLKNCWHMLLFD